MIHSPFSSASNSRNHGIRSAKYQMLFHSLLVDLKLEHIDFWDSLHGQVPNLLDWDFRNEYFLAHITTHLPLVEQKLARYRLWVIEPPTLPLGIKPNPDGDGPNYEPNLWMWVNPNIVYPPGELEVPKPSKKGDLTLPYPLLPSEEDSNFSEPTVVESLPLCASEQSPWPRHHASFPENQKFTEEENAEDQESWRLQQFNSQQMQFWPRPPLNYFQLIALALRNSAPSGLSVQEIYSFIQHYFPFFQMGLEGWKNTIRHNLCSRENFEKIPFSKQSKPKTRSRACFWKLTKEGHRRFVEEIHAFEVRHLRHIQQCMRQPDMIHFLFDF
ncbi:forkhead box protein R1-like [Orycteropus afer afer]|uniref:Forkhead box protein R1-like n=1 Tax=Orycteropus afer afer TaxID=1230840 RepID=A0AC54ZDX0_ORYAF|nr:forkhead box protein R1-like [Orycteropus afer afer]